MAIQNGKVKSRVAPAVYDVGISAAFEQHVHAVNQNLRRAKNAVLVSRAAATSGCCFWFSPLLTSPNPF
jgi:hypothetical protein